MPMPKRYLLIILSCLWLVAAALVSIATVALVAESGWSELPLAAWLMLAALFGVALPLLLYAGYRWVLRADVANN